MTEGVVGLIGAAVVVAASFVWVVVEHKHTVRRQRKYDKRMAEYDQWGENR